MARTIARFILAAAVGIVAAIVFHSLSVQAGLTAIGAKMTLSTRLGTIGRDLLGLAPSYGIVVAIALAIGFVVAAWLKWRLRPLAPVAYPLAGAAALAAALALMHVAYDGVTPIAGARGPVGFLLQCFAGGLAGAVFAFTGCARKQR